MDEDCLGNAKVVVEAPGVVGPEGVIDPGVVVVVVVVAVIVEELAVLRGGRPVNGLSGVKRCNPERLVKEFDLSLPVNEERDEDDALNTLFFDWNPKVDPEEFPILCSVWSGELLREGMAELAVDIVPELLKIAAAEVDEDEPAPPPMEVADLDFRMGTGGDAVEEILASFESEP